MSRAALSAARAVRVLEILSGDAGRAFSLTELVRDTETNFASCYAVLTELTARGWLQRDEASKTYRLGPALFASGQAMAQADPLLQATLSGAQGLARSTQLSTGVSARVGDDLVGISRHGQARRPSVGLPIGQRLAFAPPIGATLIAWAEDDEVDLWLARGGIATDSEAAANLRTLLADIRSRGYIATMRTASYAAMSATVTGRDRAGGPRRRGISARDLFGSLCQPEPADRHGEFDISYIGAPIFDAAGRPLYSVTLSGFPARIGWRDIEGYADELTRMCAAVMHQARAL